MGQATLLGQGSSMLQKKLREVSMAGDATINSEERHHWLDQEREKIKRA